jgi:hypothetical protein
MISQGTLFSIATREFKVSVIYFMPLKTGTIIDSRNLVPLDVSGTNLKNLSVLKKLKFIVSIG